MNRRIMMIGSACAAAFAAVRALPQGSGTSQGSDASRRLNVLFDQLMQRIWISPLCS